MECVVHRLPMRNPGDAGGVTQLIKQGKVKPDEIVAIMAKTEGNGCVNDFTRAFALSSFSAALAPLLGLAPAEVSGRIPMVMSGGTEGGLSPHCLVFAVSDRETPTASRKALAIGIAATRPFQADEIGRMPQVVATAAAVRVAVRRAGIEDDRDVHWVQVKCPLLTSECIAQAISCGSTVATVDGYASMGLSRGASALGVAVAFGEVDGAAITNQSIGRDLGLWATRASASAGIELMHSEIIVLGNAAGWAGNQVIAHDVMADAIDLPALGRVLRSLDLPESDQLDALGAARITAVLAKAEASRSGSIRGARHIMNEDSDIHATRHARALVGGVLAGKIGRTDLFVSGGAEHQGPDGGGPIAVIARRPSG